MTPSTLRRLTATAALFLGSLVAWVDTRPNWDDTGITAGALFSSAGVVAALGLSWWLSALLVAFPIVLLELRSAGWGTLLILAFTTAGSVAGTAFRRLSHGQRAN